MQPNTRLDPGMVDNADRFTDPFFQRFPLRPAPAPLQLTDEISKTYSFPTFYADVTCAIAIFLCDRDRARALTRLALLMPETEREDVILEALETTEVITDQKAYFEVTIRIDNFSLLSICFRHLTCLQ